MAPTDVVTKIDGHPVRMWVGRLYNDDSTEIANHDIRVYVARVAIADAPVEVQRVVNETLQEMPAPRELPFYETLLDLRKII